VVLIVLSILAWFFTRRPTKSGGKVEAGGIQTRWQGGIVCLTNCNGLGWYKIVMTNFHCYHCATRISYICGHKVNVPHQHWMHFRMFISDVPFFSQKKKKKKKIKRWVFIVLVVWQWMVSIGL